MTEYDVSEKFEKVFKKVLENKSYVEFNPIREQELTIHCLVAVKTNNEAEPLEINPPVVLKKVPPEFKVLTKGHYYIRICNYFWEHASDTEVEAAIHRALMGIQVDKNPKTGKISLKKRKPDVVEYRATVNRYGAYSEVLIDFRDAFKASAKVFAESQKQKA